MSSFAENSNSCSEFRVIENLAQSHSENEEHDQISPAKRLRTLVHNPYTQSYYTNTFPYETVRRMLELNTANQENGYSRDFLEFAFTYPSNSNEGQTYWKRYLAFVNERHFRSFVENNNPLRIDLVSYGFSPVYFWRGQAESLKFTDENYTQNNSATLVLDVDLDDYNDVRTCSCVTTMQHCCQCHSTTISAGTSCDCEWKNLGAICPTCWRFATAAMLVLDFCLRNFWGFIDFYFVFSGKRGFHCWILDPHTEEYTAEERTAFLQSFKPWISPDRLIMTDEENPRQDKYSRQLDEMVELVFERVILPSETIFCFKNEDTRKFLWSIFDPESMTEAVFDRFEPLVSKESQRDPFVLWNNCKSFIDSVYPANVANTIKRRITYRYTFPRLDEGVTESVVHPRKSPFSLHPETDKVCIPLIPHHLETIFEFQPSQAPFSIQTAEVGKIAAEFDRELSVSSHYLKEITYCRKSIKSFEVPIIDEELSSRAGQCALIFKTLKKWLQDNNASSWLIAPWDESHIQHQKNCTACPKYVYYPIKSTLSNWIIEHAWQGEAYSKTLELALRVTWLVYLNDKFSKYPPSDRIKDALLSYCKEWGVVDV